MATVQLPDAVWDRYVETLREYEADPVACLVNLVNEDVRRKSTQSEWDGLTGCRTGSELSSQVSKELLAVPGGEIYEQSFLCVDVENFMHYLDYFGLTEGDKALVAIAEQLRKQYGDENVFRYGGDEYVVSLRGSRARSLPSVDGLSLKHSIVSVSLHRSERRHHHQTSWILLHIHRGIVESSAGGGTPISCGDSPYLRNTKRSF